MRNLILFVIPILLLSCHTSDKQSIVETKRQNQIDEMNRIDSLYFPGHSNRETINGWEKCAELHTNEKNQSSLENFDNKYIKDILRPYYSIEEDTVPTVQSNHITEYFATIVKPSLLYFKINSNLVKNLELTLTGKPFRKEQHSITTSNPNKCCLIDNKVYWGTDGTLPVEQFDKFEIRINGKKVTIPVSAYNDLFEPLWCGGAEHKGIIIATNDGTYIIFIMNGSDGAGSYTASFIFKNAIYIGRIVESMC